MLGHGDAGDVPVNVELRLVLAQLDFMVGDISGNREKALDAALRARDALRADCIVFPELTLSAYPPEDLLLRSAFLQQAQTALVLLAQQVRGIDVIVGFPRETTNGCYNAAALLREGEVFAVYHKQHLPNYGVFDEKRYFHAGNSSCVVTIKDVPVGITICEDIWQAGPMAQAAAAGARLIINLNASPFHVDKGREREEVVSRRVHETGLPVVYVNLVGGQDELVFDGGSFVMDAAGEVTHRSPALVEAMMPVDLCYDGHCVAVAPVAGSRHPALPREEGIYRAIVLGVQDYIEKNRFAGVVIGLSGGIDSALTLAIAVDAIGAERVEAVMMPSRYSAAISVEDAQRQCEIQGVAYQVISIEPLFSAFLSSLAEVFAGAPRDATEENIQARCRGILLMALSNKQGRMVLTTGNKSEMSVGYATLYGDMAGGFAPIKDVPKTLVYRLAEYRNNVAPVIPQRVLERPPSAELAPDQRDEDTLPSYEVLDPILELYIECGASPAEIIDVGYDAQTVRRVVAMVDRNEYKRRQAPPGVRITQCAFGRDRRYPITSGFSENSILRADDY